jgi:hypothetical protein
MSEPIPQDVALQLQLAAIAGNEPASSYFEIRPLTPDGRLAVRERSFVPVRELDEAMRRICEAASRLNVFVGAAPRVREDGTAEAVERVWCLWTDLDGPDALARLRDFCPLPSIVIRTGSGGGHAYWPLRVPLEPQSAQRANRRLALALGGDMAATDPARILRPAGSLNHKHRPPRVVRCTRLECHVFTGEQVVGSLPDSDHYTPRPHAAPTGRPSDPSRIIAGLARTVRDAPTGNRNHTLYWATCRVVERADAGDLDERQALEELRAAGLDVGLTEHEVNATIRSGLARRARVAA